MAYHSHALSVNRHSDFTILEVELELEVVCKECLTKDLVGVNLHVTENVWFILCGPSSRCIAKISTIPVERVWTLHGMARDRAYFLSKLKETAYSVASVQFRGRVYYFQRDVCFLWFLHKFLSQRASVCSNISVFTHCIQPAPPVKHRWVLARIAVKNI